MSSTQQVKSPPQPTNVKIQLNMGFMDGEEERKLQEPEAQANLRGLIQHMKDILPDPDDLDLARSVQKIAFVSLELGQWTSYNMQLTVGIHHAATISCTSVVSIIDAIYENGANFPFTPDAEDALPYTFLYPYNNVCVVCTL